MGEAVPNRRVAMKKRKRSRLTKEEIVEALRAVLAAKKGIDIYHVIWDGGDRWGVLREGCKRMHKIHGDKQSAVAHAKRLAQKSSKWEVAVHRKDASVENFFSSYK